MRRARHLPFGPMRLARLFRNVLRALSVFAVIGALLLLYGLRRSWLMLRVGKGGERRARLAQLQGSMLRQGMASLGACFVKLGQVMSSRTDLFEPQLIDELRHLQDRLPPFAFAHVQRTLEAQLQQPS